MKVTSNVLTVFLSVMLLAGCAGHSSTREHLAADAWPELGQQQKASWWSIQFIKQWPEDSPPPYHYDVMLAEQAIRPALNHFKEQIALWRFHRRAARDDAGSKFGFIFYAAAQDAQAITAQITSDPLVTELLDNKYIEAIWVDDFTQPARPKISDASDGVWPEEIQNSWPYYIMGVSQSWLALIHEFSSRQPLNVKTASLEEIIEYYAGVTVDLDQYWKEVGGHAYIHHLNALFGYRPVQVRF